MRKPTASILFLAFTLTGCSNTGAFISANQTIVNLNEGNYTIAAANVVGESEVGYVLGISYSNGPLASTLAIARVTGSGMMYSEALENLWQILRLKMVPLKAKKLRWQMCGTTQIS